MHAGTSFFGGTYFLYSVLGNTDFIFLLENLAFALNGYFQIAAKGVHATHTYPVQTTGNLIGVFVEFTTCVQHGHNHLQGRSFLLGVHGSGDTPAIVLNGDGIVFVNGNFNILAIAGEGFIDRVVDHLINQVVEAFTPISPIYMAGRFRTASSPLQYLDTIRTITIVVC